MLMLTRPATDPTLATGVVTTVSDATHLAKQGVTGRRFPDQYLTEYGPLFDHSPKMKAVKEMLEEVADTSATILFRGESGVGKDVAARAVHAASPRADRPFVKVNCAALPAELLESELFGHEKGAFTGAYRRKLGKFEFAHQGTIFLDEIGELPLALQAKLLHVVEDLQFSRIGGRELITVDTRILAATNRDLEAALTRREFREDLYYRLNVVEMRLPPLRERPEEIVPLAAVFLARFNQQYGRDMRLSPDLTRLFAEYSWPGNIRELENVVRRLVVLGNARQIEDEIRSRLRPGDPVFHLVPGEVTQGLRAIARRAAHEAERAALAQVLDRVHWNRAEAARILKVSYKTLLTKIAECGLDPKPARHSS
jgi:two-component system, NtrC family, response regulator AtoC